MTTVATGPDCSVLVTSCDAYSDLWPPFFHLFNRFWPDCPFPVYLLSNWKQSGFANVETVAVGADVSWSDNLLRALDRIETPYVMLYIEDQFVSAKVRSERVEALLEWVRGHSPDYVRLIPSPQADQPFDAFAGKVSQGTLYRTSTVVCLWKVATLREILRPGESAWEFEFDGSQRSDRYDSFFALRDELFPSVHGVVRGAWLPSVVRQLRALGVAVDTQARRAMTRRQLLMFRLAQLRARMLRLVPPARQRAVRSAVKGARDLTRVGADR